MNLKKTEFLDTSEITVNFKNLNEAIGYFDELIQELEMHSDKSFGNIVNSNEEIIDSFFQQCKNLIQ